MTPILRSNSSKVLLLGSGFVAGRCLGALSDSDVAVTVGKYLENIAQLTGDTCAAEELAEGVRHATAISLDINNTDAMEAEVATHDIVISLVPYVYHPQVIKAAIKERKNIVTTSYVSPAMIELDQGAKDAGITVMNEIGLDPGIDHLYAVKTAKDVHSKGGKILSFLSYCGGLPAPEASGNPLCYKFSWSSRGVLLALRNSAKYYKNGNVEEIDGTRLMETAKPYLIYQGFAFVAYILTAIPPCTRNCMPFPRHKLSFVVLSATRDSLNLSVLSSTLDSYLTSLLPFLSLLIPLFRGRPL
ncbi:unnamed protein product [Tuber melanosporum]|uniref:(Perigord truffle) hypothetical protein n=1 Tax=Tuber melanosporum (strain Mel28) TaxID=656061 RepID=D5G581_TUBMM|nr:uncharacterized protein GSTUM_00000349001 [Tuber melanosporum]CAZ79674.1 unnamed protein product [Tuber melanosporum]